MDDCFNLGTEFGIADGVPQGYSIAHAFFVKSCDEGNADGCTNLGYLYSKGLGGVAQNYSKARVLYLKGCDGNEPNGCINLGIIYEFGQGVDKDIVKTRSFYQKACILGKKEACKNFFKSFASK